MLALAATAARLATGLDADFGGALPGPALTATDVLALPDLLAAALRAPAPALAATAAEAAAEATKFVFLTPTGKPPS